MREEVIGIGIIFLWFVVTYTVRFIRHGKDWDNPNLRTWT